MSSTAYVTIRDDSGLASLSVNERDFLRSCALRGAATTKEEDEDDNPSKVLRLDGRRGHDVRTIKLRLHRWDNGAETTVQWGAGTRVSAVCSAELVPPPSLDRPNEGLLVFEVDLSPMASPGFRLAPAVSTGPGGGGRSSSSSSTNFSNQEQRLLSNRILRCLERIILMGGALDTEALVVEGGKWVWKLTLSITVLDAGGNILDASVLAAVAALRHYRKPQISMTPMASITTETTPTNEYSGPATSAVNMSLDRTTIITLPTLIPSTVKEATPLPLHHSPLSISFGLIPADDAVHSTSSTSVVAALMDPTDREELVASGTLTIAMNIHSEICLLDYGGGCELLPDQLKKCCRAAQGAIQELCQLLERTLQEADEQAQTERLRLLQLQQQASNVSTATMMLPPLPTNNNNNNNNIPFLQQLDDQLDVDTTVDDSQITDYIQTAAEEAYRKQALDYSTGHIATAVREDIPNADRPGSAVTTSSSSASSSSLLAAMLKSVGQNQKNPSIDATTTVTTIDVAPIRGNDNNTMETTTTTTTTITPMDPEDTTAAAANNKPPVTSKSTTLVQPKKVTRKDAIEIDDDDDDEEEEETVMLQSEFDVVVTPKTTTTTTSTSTTQQQSKTDDTMDEEGPDIDDLSMAIKSSKKDKKKKKVHKKK
ncbi:3' exoribonuclease family, domain containing protein [Nitzschia inconspicua]|uniref:3' exoribonuclease family, domain containing protein n=1 Tax=Nitzschia inconspicua TaxID=303405 RepID=A0A9K3M2Q0_9STRA|nr:3' exoribonuclease family, domain containing protein [Nitzschia inconspicua]KAG7372964.1 3' exoribonuclease family, domain containing protein [Nitzschia inconspicua]